MSEYIGTLTTSLSPSTGALKDKPDRRDFKIAGIQTPIELPESFRLPDSFPVKNQNGFGSCTAQSTASHKQLQENIELSARFLYAMTKKLEGNTEWGAYTRNAFKVLCDIGSIEENKYPERHDITELEYLDWNIIPKYLLEEAKEYKSKTYWRVDNNIDTIKQAIYQNKQIVVISVPWYSSYNNPSNGYLELLDSDKGTKYGHAIAIIGWLDNNWLIVKNSWGKNWGLNGICYFNRFYPIWDAWCSLDLPKELPINNAYGIKRTPITILNEYKMVITWSVILKRIPSVIEAFASIYGGWDASTIFRGVNGDIWLFKPKAVALKDGFNYKYVPWK